MWLTWAKAAGVDSSRLSLAMPGDPFRTGLIGIPVSDFTGFARWVGARGKPYVEANRSSMENHWCNISRGGTKLDRCKRLGIKPKGEGFQAGMITHTIPE